LHRRRTARTSLISEAFETALVAQLDRASDFESEGREFESLRARHFDAEPGTCRFGDAATSARGNWFFERLLPIVVTRRASTSFFARIKTEYEDRIIAILNGHS
jgi:hypothetical protein